MRTIEARMVDVIDGHAVVIARMPIPKPCASIVQRCPRPTNFAALIAADVPLPSALFEQWHLHGIEVDRTGTWARYERLPFDHPQSVSRSLRSAAQD